MKILVLGAAGMLGRTLVSRLSPHFQVVGTVRGAVPEAGDASATNDVRMRGGISAGDLPAIASLLDEEGPDAVVNCIGVVKQLEAAKDAVVSISINAPFPHQLAALCRERGSRLIHISTDCVFSGRRGPYSEADEPDAVDLYGRTKLLGEVAGPGCLTVRTSIIGRDPGKPVGLVEWFLSQRGGRVRGFARALYTGLTTNALADVLRRVIVEHPDLEGVWQVSADVISKYDLLQLLNRAYGLGITIERDETFVCDRRLDSTLFRARTGITPPTWRQMIDEMVHNG